MMIMAACFNGRERNITDWRKLFEQADQGFAFKGVTHMPGSSFSIIEHVWEACRGRSGTAFRPRPVRASHTSYTFEHLILSNINVNPFFLAMDLFKWKMNL